MGTPWTRAVRKPAAVPDAERPGEDRRRPSRRNRQQDQWPVVGAVSAGGGLGAAARHAADLIWPFPWTKFAVNVAGCVLIGALMALAAAHGRRNGWPGPSSAPVCWLASPRNTAALAPASPASS
ncbi:FluC/FEX family fluoride channel [Streptomyces sp. NPDC002536]